MIWNGSVTTLRMENENGNGKNGNGNGNGNEKRESSPLPSFTLSIIDQTILET